MWVGRALSASIGVFVDGYISPFVPEGMGLYPPVVCGGFVDVIGTPDCCMSTSDDGNGSAAGFSGGIIGVRS